MIIWRCAVQTARIALLTRTPVQEVLLSTGTGYTIPHGVQPPQTNDLTELATWIRAVAQQL